MNAYAHAYAHAFAICALRFQAQLRMRDHACLCMCVCILAGTWVACDAPRCAPLESCATCSPCAVHGEYAVYGMSAICVCVCRCVCVYADARCALVHFSHHKCMMRVPPNMHKLTPTRSPILSRVVDFLSARRIARLRNCAYAYTRERKPPYKHMRRSVCAHASAFTIYECTHASAHVHLAHMRPRARARAQAFKRTCDPLAHMRVSSSMRFYAYACDGSSAPSAQRRYEL